MPLQGFFTHLEELRRRALVCVAAVAAGAALAWTFSPALLEALLEPLGGADATVYFFAPQDAFVTRLRVAMFAGAMAASPVVITQAWLFVSPGLKPGEKRVIAPVVVLTTGLFLAGAAFAFFVVLPAALRFLLGMQTGVMRPMLSVAEYVGFLTSLLFAFGVAFNLPAFILALAWAGVVTPAALGAFRKTAVVLIFVAAAILTPGPDVASQLLLAGPLFVLYEASVFASRFVARRR